MAFDAQPDAQVTARDRVIQLRDFLARLPDERFDIRHCYTTADGKRYPSWYELPAGEMNSCGTAACIAGWACIMFAPDKVGGSQHAGALLGIYDGVDQHRLFMPDGYKEHSEDFTRARAVAVLDRYLAEGEIDWGVAVPSDGGS